MDPAADDPETEDAPDSGRRPRRLTGWLVTWPASTLLNVIYTLLVEHASGEQVDDLNAKLDASFDITDPDEVAAVLERGIALEQAE